MKNLISPVLSDLFNKSFMTGTFPGLFKQARAHLFLKVVVGMIQIIIVLSLFYQCLVKYLRKLPVDNYIVTLNISVYLLNHKFGFREGVSTSHAIINKLQFVYDNLDSGDLVL